MNLSKIILFGLSLLLTLNLYSTIYYAGSDGNWGDNGTWVDGSGLPMGNTPGCGDTVVIPAGIIVTVAQQTDYTACASPLIIYIDGELHFVNGRKLKLPCNSGIYVSATGIITAGGGGGNSNYIEICAVKVWSAGDGDFTGPATLPSTLPVELINFYAEQDNNTIQIFWSTASEINNDYFTIEKSTDGINFEFIDRVQGAGNSNQLISYSTVDNNPQKGISYYRLKQTDFDGKFEYSDIISIEFTDINENSGVNVFPNPIISDNLFYVDIKGFNPSENAEIIIYNLLGKIVFSDIIATDINGNNLKTINPVNNLSSGTYILIIYFNNLSFRKKLIIE